MLSEFLCIITMCPTWSKVSE